MSVMTTAQFAKLMWPGLNKTFGLNYNEYPPEYVKLFDVAGSTKAYEEDQGLTGFGLAVQKSEGSGIIYDEASQSFTMRYVNQTYTLGFAISQETIEDNQYDLSIVGKNQSAGLGRSMRLTKEFIGANLFNNLPAAFVLADAVHGAGLSAASAHAAAIGTIIGHEISHSFDDQGAQFDAHGALRNWWTARDLAHFKAASASLAHQFSAYHPFADVAVDGQQTLSENIADIGGLKIAFAAYQNSLKGKPVPAPIDGFMHPVTEMDSLGTDKPETKCKMGPRP